MPQWGSLKYLSYSLIALFALPSTRNLFPTQAGDRYSEPDWCTLETPVWGVCSSMCWELQLHDSDSWNIVQAVSGDSSTLWKLQAVVTISISPIKAALCGGRRTLSSCTCIKKQLQRAIQNLCGPVATKSLKWNHPQNSSSHKVLLPIFQRWGH